MFYNRITNEKINKLHERSLRILYNDDTLSFIDLLIKDNSVTMHVRNLRLLATEMFKVKNNLSPSFIVGLFPKFETGYNLRNKREFIRSKVKTVQLGMESIRYFSPTIRDTLPEEIKSVTTLDSFKQKIQNWDGMNCPCRLCKDFCPSLGFL